jgi:predicted nucleotidyltransferase
VGDTAEAALDEGIYSDIQSVISQYPLSLVLVFGSAARNTRDSDSDIDLAVEFDDIRPEDDGYSETYLGLLSDLDDALSCNVDVVDVHTMSPQFAYVVFDEGMLLLGSETRREEIRCTIVGESPSVSEGRDRVSAAAKRLREES